MINWNFPHIPFKKWAKKYGNIFGMYFGDIPCIVACDYETVKEVLNRPEFDGKPDIFGARIRNVNVNKKLGNFCNFNFNLELFFHLSMNSITEGYLNITNWAWPTRS